MTVSLKHTKVSAKADGPDSTLIQASDWNAEHGLTAAANVVLGTTSAGSVGEISCTAAGRALLDDADATAQRATLGLVIGTDVQAQDAELSAIAGLTSAADALPYFTGSGTAATTTLTAAARTVLDDASTSDMRTTLGAAASGAATSSGLTMATSRILGRTTASSGAVEEITVGSGLTLTGGTLDTAGGGGIDVQTFTSSGTWTKPSGYGAGSRVLVQAWGGGGSGARSSTALTAGGGGGGGYLETWMTLSQFGATETVTIGAGGASRTGSNQNGAAGGNTTIGSLITAYGGSGATYSPGSGGNGGATHPAYRSVAEVAGGNPAFNFYEGEGYQQKINGCYSANAGPFGGNMIGGGGGSSGSGSSPGAGSLWGGGGGGCANGSASGGTSTFGGNGGAGGATGSAGSQPGGGGGGGTSTSGAGGNGQMIVTVFPA